VSSVSVHARGLNFTTDPLVSTADGSTLAVASFSEDARAINERWVLSLAEPTSASSLRLSFSFTGRLSDTVIGFYASSFLNSSNASRPLVQTKFEPAFARTAFPCFDEPALKARFNLTVKGARPGYATLANTPALSSTTETDGTVTVVFKSTPVPVSTYQLTMVSAPMVNVSGSLPANSSLNRTAAVPVTAWAMDRGGAANVTAALQFALHVALDVLSFYETTFAFAFYMPKVDLVYLPAFPVGAMEQVGLVTFTESYLTSTASTNYSRSASVVAHELAHQWWGNAITTAWWDSLWLQEGFATFWPFSSLAQSSTAKAAGVDAAAGWRATTAGAMAEDAFAHSASLTISTPVASSGQSYAAFSGITYDKGAAVIAALQRRVEASSAGSFQRGLNAYLQAKMFGSAVPADLFDHLSEASGVKELQTEFAAYTFSPGLPLVTASLVPGGVQLSQSRFFASAASRDAAGQAAQWTLALTPRAASPSAALQAAMGGASALLPSQAPPFLPYNSNTDGWLLLSSGSSAEYFRVLYPIEVYELLKGALVLNRSTFGDDARAALLDDIFALAESGLAPGLNCSFALAWAAAWAGADAAPSVQAILRTRLVRMQSLLVDDMETRIEAITAAGGRVHRPPMFIPGVGRIAVISDPTGASVGLLQRG
jgi:aminopeptidase N